MAKYVALLRGINVGGKNVIRMTDLKTCFEASSFRNVTTYIQSGNVLFEDSERNRDRLAGRIENAIANRFSYTSPVVVLSHRNLKDTVALAPKSFGKEPDNYRYDAIFLKRPLTAKQAKQNISTKQGVDTVFVGKGVLYFARLISKASQSHLARIVRSPTYKLMTIRNWNTTTKLLKLMEDGNS